MELSSIDKPELIAKIVGLLEAEVSGLKAAALQTYAAATGEENKAENKYDTRALEASYLAGAQAKRVKETEASLGVFRTIKSKSFSNASSIESTAIVELDLDGKSLYVFVVPSRGSLTIDYRGNKIQVITPQSPLGEALLGLKIGDIARVDKADKQLEYEVIAIA